MPPGDLQDRLNSRQRPYAAAAEVARLLDRHHPRARHVPVARPAASPPRAAPAVNTPPSPSSTRIISPDSCAGPPASELTGCAVRSSSSSSPPGRACRAQRDLVAHRPARQEHRGLEGRAAPPRGPAARRRRIQPPLLVADLRRRDRRPHALRGPGLRVAVEVDRRHRGAAYRDPASRARPAPLSPAAACARTTPRPSISRSTSSLELCTANDARVVACTPSERISGCAQWWPARTHTPSAAEDVGDVVRMGALQRERHQRTAIREPTGTLNGQARDLRRADERPSSVSATSACSWARIAVDPDRADPVDGGAQPDRLGDLRGARPRTSTAGRSRSTRWPRPCGSCGRHR